MERPHPLFRDRREAGVALGLALSEYRGADVVVLGIPRGGVPVGYEVAQALGAPLDVFVVRKLGVPGREELAMGAIASGGWIVLDRNVVATTGMDRRVLEGRVRQEAAEVIRREQSYREGRPPPDVRGRIVVVVDDGLATGSTMRAAVKALEQQRPQRLVIAVPVGSPDTCAQMRQVADEVVCLELPEPLYAVGIWYSDFTPTSDDEVRRLLSEVAASQSAATLA